MFDLRFDLTDLEKQARALGTAYDQIPFTLSLALNAAAKKTKEFLVKNTWPQHVTQRNARFINAALQIDFSMKYNLRIEIFDSLNRGSLMLHGQGGTKLPKGSNLAIPISSNVRRGATGIPKGLRPRELDAKYKFVANLRGRGDAVWLRIGPKGRHLKMMYVLKPSASIAATVPFWQDFQESMRDELRAALPAAMARAMSTRR
jgi:hypothetical protein